VHYTETEFYLLQQEADRRWWIAASLAVGVHLAVVLTVLFMPSLFATKPIVEEVVSVSLVALPEVGGGGAPALPAPAKVSKPAPEKKVEPAPPPPPPPTPPEPAAPPTPAAPPEPVTPQPTSKVAVEPETKAPEPVETKNPISLAPDKRKIKKAEDTRLEEEKVKEREQEERKQEERELQKKIEERKREAEQRKQEEQELQKKIEERKREAEKKEALKREDDRKKALAQARLDQIRAENEAREAAAEARELAAQANAANAALASARADAARKAAAMQSAATGTTAGRAAASGIVAQTYGKTAASRIKEFWQLPDTRSWDNNLSANVVITINKKGEVVSIQFERRSGDPQFDQLVEKTIHRAVPMPPFPALMAEETTEVPCNFNVRELGKLQ
jgi:colicin import membrane protein